MKIAVLVLALGLSTSLSARSQSLNDQIREQERRLPIYIKRSIRRSRWVVTDADLRTYFPSAFRSYREGVQKPSQQDFPFQIDRRNWPIKK